MKPLLECKNVSKYFGDFAAVKNLDFQVFPGEIYGIAGPNGAGKTTLFNVITAIPSSLTSGKIIFDGQEIQRLKAHQICHRGIARTFQIPNIFERFTYLENVMIGNIFGKTAKAGRISKSPVKTDPNSAQEGVIDVLRMVGLLEKKDVSVRGVSLFDMKRLMLASALATRLKLILLDEPMGGLNKAEIEQSLDLIRKINKQGITIVIIEHMMTALMTICDRVMILHCGEKISEGKPEEVGRDKAAIKVYLGEEYHIFKEADLSA